MFFCVWRAVAAALAAVVVVSAVLPYATDAVFGARLPRLAAVVLCIYLSLESVHAASDADSVVTAVEVMPAAPNL